MFGFGSSGAVVRERAGKVRVMVAMISANLYTKTAPEFVTFYKGITRVEQRDDDIFFGLKLSPSSWYDVCATYPQHDSEPSQPTLSLIGGGDDYGVFINAMGPDGGACVEVHVVSGQRPGKDAMAIVAELLKLPGFSAAPDFI